MGGQGSKPKSQCDQPNIQSWLSAAKGKKKNWDINFGKIQNPWNVCKARKIKLNQLRNAVVKKQDQIDACYPDEKKARIVAEYNAATDKFIKENEQKLYKTREQLSSTWILLRKLVGSLRISDEYKSRLEKEIQKLHIENKELEQTERRHRRNFMDNEPQSGVPSHMLGFQTSDDKSLLIFWSSFLFFLIVGSVALNLLFGISITGISVISLAVIIAVFCLIYTFG
jgi:hypothetical protein